MIDPSDPDNLSTAGGLLGAFDQPPFELVNEGGRSPVLLVCEHAGRAVPQVLGDLGVSKADMDRHIAYDIGAEASARLLSEALDAPLVLQPYSRLVVDCNRPFEAADCVPVSSDGAVVPANRFLDAAQRRVRYDEIHVPFHDQVARLIDDRAADDRHTMVVAVHSFVRRLNESAADRSWHLGLLYNRNGRLARLLMDAVTGRKPGLHAAFNEPYRIDDRSDFTIPVHGEARGIDHVLVEIRNDLIAEERGQRDWAELIAGAISDILVKEGINDDTR